MFVLDSEEVPETPPDQFDYCDFQSGLSKGVSRVHAGGDINDPRKSQKYVQENCEIIDAGVL